MPPFHLCCHLHFTSASGPCQSPTLYFVVQERQVHRSTTPQLLQLCVSADPSAQLGVPAVLLLGGRRCIREHSFPKSPRRGSHWSPPFVGNHGDTPAFDLAELSVGNVDLQGQAGHPHRHLQGSAQVLVGEVHQGVHLAFHLLAVDKNVVTPVRNLRGEGERVMAVTEPTASATPKEGEKAPLCGCALMQAWHSGSSWAQSPSLARRLGRAGGAQGLGTA